MYHPPPLESCCLCVSLRNGTKIFGFLALLDCVSVYFSSVYGYIHEIRSCTVERMACAVVFGEVGLRTIYALFVVGMLMSLYKAANPRLILWWVFATIFVSLFTSFVMVPAMGKFSAGFQPVYIALSCWDLYGCYVGYSYYIQLTEGATEESGDA
ncbi:uncharacterized protein LOC128987327 [Macrosteles quadrilineatus]|uniref:uncharacterized protein LOC128987327 n=1 Tax=Macrosteles quadrilineatus TaxID=74068 RepID=UPI0023E111B5|nr:uncharacterized protein LOC128987327 [Macrosteles quadrilineatus]XP_054264087.1 uncharacterized protein LOC128987327 [Macrosteles quadrilineatus]XP_054264088.1 uncharacterized protein LOC128987327 [Macrosteles quadrilineatus]